MKKAKQAEPIAGVEDYQEKIARLAADFERECTLEQTKTKVSACRALAEEIVRRQRLVELELRGELPAEQARTIAGMTSNIGRWLKMLGLVEKKTRKAAGFIG